MIPLPHPFIDPDEAEKHRREDCEHYFDCLSLAHDKGYASFSCLQCDKFKKSETHISPRKIHTPKNEFFYPKPRGDIGDNGDFAKKATKGFLKVRNEIYEKFIKLQKNGTKSGDNR